MLWRRRIAVWSEKAGRDPSNFEPRWTTAASASASWSCANAARQRVAPSPSRAHRATLRPVPLDLLMTVRWPLVDNWMFKDPLPFWRIQHPYGHRRRIDRLAA